VGACLGALREEHQRTHPREDFESFLAMTDDQAKQSLIHITD
jgi:hypothetical protein